MGSFGAFMNDNNKKLEKKIAIYEKALDLAIELEPINCYDVCGHDNNGNCDYSKCNDYHKKFLLKQSKNEIKV